MKKILSIILSITMLLSMGTVAFADGVNGPMQKAKLTVGINAEFPPFEYYEGEELKGFDIDLMNYIGERIGFDIEFVKMSFDKLIPAVVNGEVDCVISAISVTDERKKVIDFSEIYLDTYEQIDETSSQITNYAIVFHGDSSEKENVLNAAGYESEPLIYTLVNDAIKELKNDGTIDKLVEKYDIPKANYAHGPGYPVDIKISGTPIQCSEWALKDVEYADTVGITDRDTHYVYNKNITREEFCELIYNLVVLVSPDIEHFIPDNGIIYQKQ